MAEESTEVTESTSEPTSEVSTGSTETPAEGESTQVDNPGEEGQSEASEQTTAETEDKSEGDKESKEVESEVAEGEFYFNGQQVQVEVPDDLKSSLSDAGVNVDTVLSELYGKDSDFALSDETRKPLDEKFGKPIVDTFLSSLKQQNDSVLKGAESAKKAAEEANAQAAEWSNELVGGEEQWDSLSEWAAGNLEESQIESFNKAMQSGDKWLQELAIKDLHSKYQNSEGDTHVSLISGDSAGSDSSGSPLGRDEYIAEMTSPEFMKLRGQDKDKAQAQLDARRRAGQRKGL